MMLFAILRFYSICPFSAPFSIICNCTPMKNLLFMPFLRKLYLNLQIKHSIPRLYLCFHSTASTNFLQVLSTMNFSLNILYSPLTLCLKKTSVLNYISYNTPIHPIIFYLSQHIFYKFIHKSVKLLLFFSILIRYTKNK